MEPAQNQLIQPNFRIIMSIWATTKASQQQSEAVTATATKKSRLTRLLDGQACQIIPGKEFQLLWFEWVYLRNMNGHTLTGLESGAMLMAGGYDYTSGDYKKDIWLLKEEVWSLISWDEITLENSCWSLEFSSWLSIEDWKLHLSSQWKRKRFEWPLPGGANQNCERRNHRNTGHRRTRIYQLQTSHLRSNGRILRLKRLFGEINFSCVFSLVYRVPK